MSKVTKHFVTFYSPGTFFPEETTQPIDSWDVAEAFQRSKTVTERYDARPYCFAFSTRERGPEDLDSKVTKRSCRYFINGRLETREQVEARNDPKESILRSNMRGNNIAAVVVTESPWKNTAALEDDDVVLDADGQPVAR